MDNLRISEAAQALKQCKSQGLSYYDASQSLVKQGYTQEEIEQASYQFQYSDADVNKDTTPISSVDQEASRAMAQDEMINKTRSNFYKDTTLRILGGRGMAGRYFGARAVSDFATLKDLEQNQLGNSSTTAPNGSGRVFQRNRAIRYYAILSLVPLVFLVPYFFKLLRGVAPLLSGHDHAGLVMTSLYLWSLFGCVAYITIAALLLLAHKEVTIIRGIYIILGIEVAIFLLMALVLRSLPIIAIGFITLLPGYFISRQVGILSQLHPSK
jgi:hypothetical protein